MPTGTKAVVYTSLSKLTPDTRGVAMLCLPGISACYTICSDGWDDYDAEAFCVAAGFLGGAADSGASASVDRSIITQAACRGSEYSFFTCAFTPKSPGGTCKKMAAVRCTEAGDEPSEPPPDSPDSPDSPDDSASPPDGDSPPDAGWSLGRG